MIRFGACFAGCLLVLVGSYASAEVSTSASGHYLAYDGQPVILAGDSGTQCVMQNSNLDHREWIDDCDARGINAVHVWSFMGARQTQDGNTFEGRSGST